MLPTRLTEWRGGKHLQLMQAAASSWPFCDSQNQALVQLGLGH